MGSALRKAWTDLEGTQNDSRCFQDMEKIILNHMVRKSLFFQILATFLFLFLSRRESQVSAN